MLGSTTWRRARPARFDVGGVPVAVVRIGDDVYAIGDTCSHANVSLSRGRGALRRAARSSAGSTAARSRSTTGEPQTLPGHPAGAGVRGPRRRRRRRRSWSTGGAVVSDARDPRPAGRGRRARRSCSGIDLRSRRGEVHAVMGPNGAGQVHAVGGRHGPARLRGARRHRSRSTASTCSPWRRGSGPRPGLFLAMQYPTEVPGVRLDAVLTEALRRRGARPVDRPATPRCVAEAAASASTSASSTGRSTSTCPAARRSATRRCSSAVLEPTIAILDELDSGLDIDALRACARRVEAATHDDRPRRAGHHPLQPPAARAARPTACTSW